MIPYKFDIYEWVCPHVYNHFIVNKKWNEKDVWEFFDIRLRVTIDFLRRKFDKPITVNNWKSGGIFSQRGLRCNLCQLVKDKKTVYMTPHFGFSLDFDVQGLTAKEARKMILDWKDELPFPIRLEDGVNWIHLDVREKEGYKVYLFKV